MFIYTSFKRIVYPIHFENKCFPTFAFSVHFFKQEKVQTKAETCEWNII